MISGANISGQFDLTQYATLTLDSTAWWHPGSRQDHVPASHEHVPTYTVMSP